MKQFWEDFFQDNKIGPKKGMKICDRFAVPSGPHYFVLLECENFISDENEHMKLTSGIQ